MNYYKQIAEMLGVELGEEFSLKNNYSGNINRSRYKITQEEGLMYSIGSKEWKRSTILLSIFSEDFNVVKLPWKPKLGEQYWYYSIAWGTSIESKWACGFGELAFWKIGNCFRTKEEAETKGKEILEAIQKEYEEA